MTAIASSRMGQENNLPALLKQLEVRPKHRKGLVAEAPSDSSGIA